MRESFFERHTDFFVFVLVAFTISVLFFRGAGCVEMQDIAKCVKYQKSTEVAKICLEVDNGKDVF